MSVDTEHRGLSIGETAFQDIRTDIILGRANPGKKLKLEDLKSQYGAGISTLREILTRLAAEGFIVAEGQKGFRVAPVSVKDLRETADLRLLLENHALEQSFARGDLEWEGNVAGSYHVLSKMEKKVAEGDDSQTFTLKRYDWEFHQSLIAACRSPILMHTHGGVFDKYIRYQMITLSDRGEISAREHKALLECALSRDIGSARDILKRHIRGGVEEALKSGKIN
jgi:DNA-binding GntR family transcriptional regulator